MKKRLIRLTAWMLVLMLCMGSITVSAAESDSSEPAQAAETVQPADDTADDEGQTANEEINEEETAPDLNSDQEESEEITEEETENQTPMLRSSGYPSGCSQTPRKDMKTGELLFLTLADNQKYRWNANSPATRSNEIHLDDCGGDNCNFRLYHIEDEWYGIKHISSKTYNGFYVDVEDKSDKEGKVLHLWESSDDKVKNNNHRQFAFYEAGRDSNGNMMYYIKVRKSGLWVGLQDNKIQRKQKLVQTSADKAKKWYVTDCVVPERNDIVTPWTEQDNSGMCYLNIPGTIDGINIFGKTGQAEINGMEHCYYRMGTSGRWALNYFPEYKAYEIESVGVQMNGYRQEKTNNVWDVPGAHGTLDKASHQWTKHDKSCNQNTNQLWRFIDAGNGLYKIQNARTGLFVGHSTDGVVVEDYFFQGAPTQVEEKNAQLIEMQLFSDEKHANIFDRSTESTDWMANVPDDALLSTVNIPGTHDTGTKYGFGDDHALSESWSATRCQNLFFEEQLQVGVRSFDIRCNAMKTAAQKASASDVSIIHGSAAFYCTDKDGLIMTLKEILDVSIAFLKQHSKETVVLMVKPDDGSVDGLVYALSQYIAANKDYFYSGGDIPSMGEARGKIVLLRRFAIDTEVYNPGESITKTLGFDISDWDTYKYGKQKEAICIYTNSENGCQVWAQDNYQSNAVTKIDYIYGTMSQSTSGKIPGNAYIYNFTSGTQEIPINMSRLINNSLLEKDLVNNGRLGMIMWNFVDETTSRLIYRTNQNTSFMEPKAIFPNKITLTYGDTLSEASLSGQSGNGTFAFSNSEKSYMPKMEDVEDGKEFTMIFTPNDSRLKSVTRKVKITEIYPEEITVKIDNKTMEYGKSQPELTYTITKGTLVGADTKASLGVSLSVDMNGAKKLTAGTWKIKGKAESSAHYKVVIDGDGTLTVTKKLLSVTWSDTSNIIYGTPDQATWDNAGANVCAELKGVIEGDDCTAKVTGGDAKDPSWKGVEGETPHKYQAQITGLSGSDKDNYELPAEGVTKDYYIRRKGADDYTLPTSATVTYGQTLADAVLEGASGDGTFTFWKDTENVTDTKPDFVGPHEYTIVYTPKDAAVEHGGGVKIIVTVLPKPITLTVSDANKTYGESAPQYTYDQEALESQLEGNDSAAALGISLTAGEGDAVEAPAGTYPVTGTAEGNPNYAVTVVNGTLTVDRRTANLTWTPEEDASVGLPVFTYNGNPVDVSASVSNLLPDDKCQVTVVNGDQTNAGTYTAVAVRLSGEDAANYRLTEETKNLTRQYQINKADPVITTWPQVSLIYGQALAEAKVEGGESGGIKGTFRFTEKDASRMPKVSDSGKTQYTMEFVPEDTVNYNTVTNDQILVTVYKKPLQITVADVQKIYGDAFDSSVLSCHYNESDLVKGDTLAVALKVYAGDAVITDVALQDVGNYSIGDRDARLNNPNYDVQITEGTLEILPREAVLQWSDTSNIVYNMPDEASWNQKGADVTATIVNLVTNDDCRVVVEGGDEKEASYQTGGKDVTIYKARAVRLEGAESGNYVFAEEDPAEPYDDYENSRIKPYVIRRAESQYVIPKAVVITYGKNLGSIQNENMIGASGEGTFVLMKDGKELTETEKTRIFETGEYKDYQVQFVPTDTNISKSEPEDIILLVVRAGITVTADNKEKTYGDKSPEYTVQVSEATPLVNGDRAEDLMTLKAVLYEYNDENDESKITGEISGDKRNSSVGTYDIVMDEQKNKNYRINFLKGSLTIGKREIEITWSDTSDLIYNGKPAGVTATVSNLVKGDTCNLTVVGGDAVNAGDYMAWVNDLDNPNYCIPSIREGDLKSRMMEYTIQKATPEVVFPKKIVVNDGDILSGAKYEASADVPGTFTFEKADAVIHEAGEYVMIFTPDDTDNYNIVKQTVKVEVKKADGGAGSHSGGKGTGMNTSDPANIWLLFVLFIMSGAVSGTAFVLKRRMK